MFLELDRRLEVLLQQRDPHGAIDAMATCTSPKHLVWWGCMCGWMMWRPAPPGPDDHVLKLGFWWVNTGDDAYRKAALELSAEETGRVSQSLLKAIVNSGGALPIAGSTAMLPTPDCSGTLVKVFVLGLLSQLEPLRCMEQSQRYVQLARYVLSQPLAALPNAPIPVVAAAR